jgi:hypothetical protein
MLIDVGSSGLGKIGKAPQGRRSVSQGFRGGRVAHVARASYLHGGLQGSMPCGNGEQADTFVNGTSPFQGFGIMVTVSTGLCPALTNVGLSGLG